MNNKRILVVALSIILIMVVAHYFFEMAPNLFSTGQNDFSSTLPKLVRENKVVKFYYMDKTVEVGKTTSDEVPHVAPRFLEIYDDQYQKNFIAYYADRSVGDRAYLTNVAFIRYDKTENELIANKTYAPLSISIDGRANSIVLQGGSYLLDLDRQAILQRIAKDDRDLQISEDEYFNIENMTLLPSVIQSADLNGDGHREYLLEYTVKNAKYSTYLTNIMVVVDYKNDFKILDAYCFDVGDGYSYPNLIDGFFE